MSMIKFEKTSSADELAATLKATSDTTLQALIDGPKDLGHLAALGKYIDAVYVQIEINSVKNNHDGEAAGHLKVLKAYVEMSSFTVFLPGGIPMEQGIDVRNQLRMHLECAQEILQKRSYTSFDKDKIDHFLSDLIDMEAKVAKAIDNIERSSEEAHIKITMK